MGYGKYGRLGHGNEENYENPKRIEVFDKLLQNGEYICNISCGGDHTVCYTNYNTIYSWGQNKHKQCGLDNPLKILCI